MSPRAARKPDSGDWAETMPVGAGVGVGGVLGAALGGVLGGAAAGAGGGELSMTATRRPRAMAARLAAVRVMPVKEGRMKTVEPAAEELRRRLTLG